MLSLCYAQQKGLRSLAACETLARLGYNKVAWVNGGLDTARKNDIDTDNGVDVRCVCIMLVSCANAFKLCMDL